MKTKFVRLLMIILIPYSRSNNMRAPAACSGAFMVKRGQRNKNDRRDFRLAVFGSQS